MRGTPPQTWQAALLDEQANGRTAGAADVADRHLLAWVETLTAELQGRMASCSLYNLQREPFTWQLRVDLMPLDTSHLESLPVHTCAFTQVSRMSCCGDFNGRAYHFLGICRRYK